MYGARLLIVPIIRRFSTYGNGNRIPSDPSGTGDAGMAAHAYPEWAWAGRVSRPPPIVLTAARRAGAASVRGSLVSQDLLRFGDHEHTMFCTVRQ
jgi:hypothetical protein